MPEDKENQSSRFTLEEVTRTAQEVLLRDGYHLPTLIAQGNLSAIILQLHDLEKTHEGRARQMTSAGFMVGQRGNIGTLEDVFLISEAWMSLGQGKMPDKSPSNDPERKEVLIISRLNVKDGRVDATFYEMVRERKRKGKLTGLKAFPSEEVENLSGESPLLNAFIYGYAMGLGRPND